MSIVSYNNRSIKDITAIPGAAKSLTHIKTLTASSDSTLDFVDGSSDVVLDSTYPIYLFKFFNLHPATDNVNFTFQANVSGASGFNETMTTTNFRAYHSEDGNYAAIEYNTADDQAQGTSYQILSEGNDNDNDNGLSGELTLFNPSSTTFVKHFVSRCCTYNHGIVGMEDEFVAGYFNVTGAIDEVSFKMSSGNVDAGTIKMYGLKDS
jgi:hypothetical protein